MTINQVIALAKKGKLKNLGAANDKEAVLGYINLGLIELYKRFPLKVEEYIIALRDGVTIYDMPSDFMWIVGAYQEVSDLDTSTFKQVPINEEENLDSLNTIGYNQVQVPTTTTGAYISVLYVAAPVVILAVDDYYVYIDRDGVEREIEDIPLPAQMIGALLDYLAYEANDTLPTTGELENKAFYQKFEASCERIRREGMYNADDLDMKARNMKGFV